MDGVVFEDAGERRGRTEAALREVLVRHGGALARLAAAWSRSPSDRDDLLQEISLALLTALPRFRGDCPERAFVLRVALHRAIRFAAERRRGEAHEPLEELELVAPLPNPDERLDEQRRLALLQRALRLLRDDQRVLLLLSLEGLRHDELAEVVGGNANSIGVRLHRARAALSETVERLQRQPGRPR